MSKYVFQCLRQELKKVRHMSRQAEKGETYRYSVVNNYLSAGRNRFDLESGPWTIRATHWKETLYPVPIKFAH